MKITASKDMIAERAEARRKVDALLIDRVNAITGDKASLYSIKYAAAVGHLSGQSSPLVSSDDEAHAIIAKATEAHAAMDLIERRRQQLQAEIDAAATVPDLQSILSAVAD